MGWIEVAIAVLIILALALIRSSSKTVPPVPPALQTQPAPVTVSSQPATAVPIVPRVEKSQSPVVTYSAFHKHAFGSQCAGTVRIDAKIFQYASQQHPIAITRETVRRVDGPGFVDADGKKWHFRFDGKTDDDVHRVLLNWTEHGRVE